MFGLLCACVGYLLLPKFFGGLYKLAKKPAIIKKYWYFVIPFSFVAVATYWLVLSIYINDQKLDIYINILNHASGLTFAIFVGYFSFLAVNQSRVDKLKVEAIQYLAHKDYTRAIKNFEEVASSEPNDFQNLANLLEGYLITKDFKSFDNSKDHFKKLIFSKDKDHLVYHYLMILSYLLKGHVVDADRHIAELINFKTQNQDTTVTWHFGDLTTSKVYTTDLKDGTESKSKLNNVLDYLQGKMDQGKADRFEGGDYILTESVLPLAGS